VRAAVQGLRDGEADACEGPREWTVRQIVHHLADTEFMRGARLFQLLVDDQPTIQGFDEGALARRLHYERDIQSSVTAFCGYGSPSRAWLSRCLRRSGAVAVSTPRSAPTLSRR
jgi:hypothetical protein